MAQTEGYSLDAQQEKLRKYAEYKNLEIVGEYCDAGKSGKSIKGRPAFQQMMEDVASQKDDVSYVLVFKLSRFGRNAADVLKSLQLLMDYEVDLVSVDDAIADQLDIFLRQIRKILMLQQIFAEHDILRGEEEDALGRTAVTPRASGLLIITLDIHGHVIVDDITHVALVDAHAEGIGSYHAYSCSGPQKRNSIHSCLMFRSSPVNENCLSA